MVPFLLFIVLVVLLVRWRILSERLAGIEHRIAEASGARVEPWELAALTRRVHALEMNLGLAETKPAPERTPVPAPAPAAVLEPVVKRFEEPPAVDPPSPVFAPEPAPLFAPLVPEPAPATRSGAEWEAMVGANWLNKLGIAVLVIALALFLGYSFSQMGPAGRSGVALAVSISLLGAGAALERRERYVLFGRGLLGGGWAALYFTVYAMQALDAARVIHNALAGGFLLLAVAAGMVVHSLRYRTQTVTGVAYAVAFATLAITPVTALSVIALIPLTASLIVIADRFHWHNTILFGLVATYATCASRGDTGAPLWSAQLVFAIYWLLFEGYDLLRARRRSNHPAEQALLPLNALAFGLLSYAKWSAAAPDRIWQLAAGMAVAYLASTILRAWLRAPSSFAPDQGTLERFMAGGYEGPVTLAAAFSAAAVALRLHGQTANMVLLAEAELLFLAGVLFRQHHPRRLAAALFAALGVKLLLRDLPSAGTLTFAGLELHDWTPFAALSALIFYGNRALRRAVSYYGYAAAALVALILGAEVPLRDLGLGWLAFAVLLFASGCQWRLADFRRQGYGAAVLALAATAWYQVRIPNVAGLLPTYLWLQPACVALAAYGAALYARRSASARITDRERSVLQPVASAAALAAAAVLLWRVVPDVYLGPAWMACGLLALEAGLRGWPPSLRVQAQFLAAFGTLYVLQGTALLPRSMFHLDERLALGIAAALAYGLGARRAAERPVLYVASAAGSLFLMVELWAILPAAAVAFGWALAALLLLAVGIRARLSGFEWQAHVTAAAVMARLCLVNFAGVVQDPPEWRILGSAVAIACLFAAQLIVPRQRMARLYYSLLATVLRPRSCSRKFPAAC